MFENVQKTAGGKTVTFGLILLVGGHAIQEQRIRPGEFVMRILFSEFTTVAEKKIESVMVEPAVSSQTLGLVVSC